MKHFIISLVSFTSILFSLKANAFSQHNSREHLLKKIKEHLIIVERDLELLSHIDLYKVRVKIEENIQNKKELKKIMLELETKIYQERGTVCHC